MNLWLRAPYCDECSLSYPFRREGQLGITEQNWENDIAWKLGEDALLEIQQELAEDPDFAFSCKRCGRGLVPWNGDAVHVVSYLLEEQRPIFSLARFPRLEDGAWLTMP